MNPIVWPWLIETGLITYRSLAGLHFSPGEVLKPGQSGPTRPAVWIHGRKRPPLPSELLSVMIVFGLFSMIAQKDERIGSLLGWGIVLATGITLFSPASEQSTGG